LDIVDELAGGDYTFYTFKGLKKIGNATLHINSNNFDESIALKAADNADVVVSIHGAKDKSEIIHIGGTHQQLKQIIMHTLRLAGFDAAISEIPGLREIRPENICNRCKTRKGVQLELSRGLCATCWNFNAECSAAPFARRYIYRATMVRDDSVAETQADPSTPRFGSIKRIKNLFT